MGETLRCLFCLSLLTVFALPFRPISAYYSGQPPFEESWQYSIPSSDVAQQIGAYLSTHPLYPVFYNVDSFDVIDIGEDHGSQAMYVLGMLTEAERSALALFSIQRGWMWNETQLVYLTDDTPLSQTLVRDITLHAELFTQMDLSDYRLFIERIEDYTSETTFQKWVYFNQHEYFELLVTLVVDEHGGTYFSVADFPN